jgi:hypothetical protein
MQHLGNAAAIQVWQQSRGIPSETAFAAALPEPHCCSEQLLHLTTRSRAGTDLTMSNKLCNASIDRGPPGLDHRL